MTDSSSTDTKKREMKEEVGGRGAYETAIEEVCMCEESVVFLVSVEAASM